MPRIYKDQLLAGKMITSLAKKHQRHLCMAQIDYKKAFDSLSHLDRYCHGDVLNMSNYKTIRG